MSKNDFFNYLNAYSHEYYRQYINDSEMIGEIFGVMSNDDDLDKWLRKYYEKRLINVSHIKGKEIPYSHIPYKSEKEGIPAYSILIEELFLEPFFNDNPKVILGTTEKDEWLADMCNLSRTAITNWKTGNRIPNKYKWWALAINCFELSYFDIPPYLHMIGCTVDLRCIEDILLMYSICTAKKTHEVYSLLKKYDCDLILKDYAPIQHKKKNK